MCVGGGNTSRPPPTVVHTLAAGQQLGGLTCDAISPMPGPHLIHSTAIHSTAIHSTALPSTAQQHQQSSALTSLQANNIDPAPTLPELVELSTIYQRHQEDFPQESQALVDIYCGQPAQQHISQMYIQRPAASAYARATRVWWPQDVGGYGPWNALVLQGDLVILLDHAALPAGVQANPAMRAEALSPRIPQGAHAAGPLAFWIYYGGGFPRIMTMVHQTGTHRPAAWTFASMWTSQIEADDIHQLGGITVTSPERTARDIATRCEPDMALGLLVKMRDYGVDLTTVAQQLERIPHLLGKPQARRLFDRLLSVSPTC